MHYFGQTISRPFALIGTYLATDIMQVFTNTSYSRCAASHEWVIHDSGGSGVHIKKFFAQFGGVGRLVVRTRPVIVFRFYEVVKRFVHFLTVSSLTQYLFVCVKGFEFASAAEHIHKLAYTGLLVRRTAIRQRIRFLPNDDISQSKVCSFQNC